MGFAMADNKYAAFLALRLDEDGELAGFSLKESLEDAIVWASRVDKKDVKSDKNPLKRNNAAAPIGDSVLKSMLSRINIVVASSYSLVNIAFDARYIFSHAFMNKKILSDFVPKVNVVESSRDWKVCGLNEKSISALNDQVNKIAQVQNGARALPSSTLMGLVSTFDSLISEIVKILLKSKKDKMNLSEKMISIKDVIAAKDIDEIVDNFITNEVYLLLRGSHSDQVKFIEDNFNIKIRNDWSRWCDFIEIFERRNLIAHGEVSYTRRYIDICNSHGKSSRCGRVGDKIILNRNYMLESVDILAEFLILSVFNIWRKNFKETERGAFGALNSVSYNFILEKRFSVADRLLSHALSLKSVDCGEVDRRMMIINRANALKKLGLHAESIGVLDSVDWGASADHFRACVAAVRSDEKEVIVLMDRLKNSDEITIDDFRSWPVFEDLRASRSFQEAFQRIWGEPIFSDFEAGQDIVRDE